MKKLLLIITNILIIPPVAMYSYYTFSPAKQAQDNPPTITTHSTPRVLGATDDQDQIYFTVNIPATFKQDISAPNIVYSVNGESGEINIDNSLKAGDGITIDGREITNTGILTLVAGDGVSVDGNTITNSGIISLSAGTGISIDGSTITNTYSFTPDYTQSGWTDNGSSVVLTTTSDTVTVGTLTTGAITASSITVDGLSVLSGNATIGNGVAVLPSVDLGSDLGSSSLRFNNLWVANINSNSSQSFSGQTTFSYPPTDTTLDEASVLINPTTSAASGQLLGLAIAGYQKAMIDEDGDITLGYSDQTSAPASDYPLNVYGHSGTRVSFVDTTGNAYFAGNVGIGTTGPLSPLHIQNDSEYLFRIITDGNSTDVFTVRSASPTNNVLYLGGILALQNNGGDLYHGTEATNQYWRTNSTVQMTLNSSGNVGIGTTSPNAKLHIGDGSSYGTATGLMFGDGDTGFYEYADDGFVFRVGGAQTFILMGDQLRGYAGNPGIRAVTSTATTPNHLPNYSDTNTGIGSAGTDILSLIAGGTNGLNVISSGNVGIGTTNPGYTLQVNGTIAAYDTDNNLRVRLTESNNEGVVIITNSVGGAVGITTDSSDRGILKDAAGGWQVVGTADATQFLIKANSSQTADILQIRNPDDTRDNLKITQYGGLEIYPSSYQGGFIYKNYSGVEGFKLQGEYGNAILTPTYVYSNKGALDIGGSWAHNGTSASEISSTRIYSTFNPSSGDTAYNGIYINPTINQSGTATGSYTALKVNAIETSALGSSNLLADFQVGGSSKVVIDNSGNVGIGTTSPYAYDAVGTKLHIKVGGGYAVKEVARFEGGSDSLLPAGGVIRIGTSNDRGMYIEGGRNAEAVVYGAIGTTESDGTKTLGIYLLNSGLIGIGTTAPQSLLDVQGDAGSAGILTLASKELTVVDGDILGRINFNAPLESDGTDSLLVGASIWAEADDTFSTTVNSTELVFGTGTSATATEAMRIDSAGNVGIGTAGPGYKLEVNGTMKTSGLANFAVGIDVEGTANSLFASGPIFYIESTNDIFLRTQLSNVLKFGTNNIEQMRITSGGLVGVGTTDPGEKLEVTGNIKTSSLTTGTVYSNSGVLTNTDPSDRNLKHNILTLEDGTLDKVLGLRPVSFNWNSTGDGGLSFIAQEVNEIFPELVGSNSDGTLGLYTTQFIPVLAKAIQEQQLEIDGLSSATESAKLVEIEDRMGIIEGLMAEVRGWVEELQSKWENLADSLTTKEVHQQTLCIGEDSSDETCLDKTQIDQLLELLPLPTPDPSSTPEPSASPSPEPSPTPDPTPEASDSGSVTP